MLFTWIDLKRSGVRWYEQNRLIERASGPQNIGSVAYVLKYAYDLNSNLNEIRPVIGAVTTLTYDALDRLATRTDAQASISRYFYDRADQLIEFRDPRSVITTYKVDGFGQVLEESSPDTGLIAHTFDAAGLLTQTTRADGGVLARTYDGLGRLTTNTATIGAQTETHTTIWDFVAGCANGKGRVCRVTDPHQTLTLSYSREGELTSQQRQIGWGESRDDD